jgi:preprotein translocase subunit SecB
MGNFRQDSAKNTKIIKHYIKDLSFENLQDVSSQNFRKDDVDLSDNIKAIFQTYNEKNFSVLLKYNCNCTFKKMGRKVFILEIDYFGLFEINERENYTQNILTESGITLLYPKLKSIVEYLSQNGTFLSISLNDLDFNTIKS